MSEIKASEIKAPEIKAPEIKAPEIKAIMFDYGGVYIESPFAVISEIAVEMDVPDALLKEITFGDFYVDGNHPWHRLERGEIGLEETRELILEEGKKHNLVTDMYEMFARFADIDKCMREELASKTLEWKNRGYKLAIITNNLKEFDGWRKSFPYDIEEVYDVISDSSYLEMRKPNKEIYQHTLDQLGVNAEEALFLDDHAPNIESSQAMGIHSFVVEGDIQYAINWVESKLHK